mmetsp:Transcript_1763/g.7682  ORF Transcript_1763/g.7682 Transcript_1763/m.7682 type:complete len:82 (+) Transcript_1763:134-379(+)
MYFSVLVAFFANVVLAQALASRPLGQKVLAVDVGTRKTGLACGGGFGQPKELGILRHDLRDRSEERIEALIQVTAVSRSQS